MQDRLKVLWLSPLPGYARKGNAYGGGGWISSLVAAVSSRPEVKLAISYPLSSKTLSSNAKEDGILRFPLPKPHVGFGKLGRFFALEKQDRMLLESARKVVREYRPDILQVFGLESVFGLLAGEGNVPVVLHLQGLLGPCVNAWVPPGYRLWDDVVARGWNPIHIALRLRSLAFNRHMAMRERRILKTLRFVMGRTEWDRHYCSLFAPQANYFPCGEILRPEFYGDGSWSPPSSPSLVSIVSTPLYKGHDMILKTARVLLESGCGTLEWKVFGVDDFCFAERKTGIRARDVNVQAMGVATAAQLRDALLSCSVYVHPSYIDNSSNSVCEAQILGVPVVATNVGGVSSLFSPEQSSRLVPANDPFSMAFRIREALAAPESFTANRDACRARHDPAAVCERLMEIYRDILAG